MRIALGRSRWLSYRRVTDAASPFVPGTASTGTLWVKLESREILRTAGICLVPCLSSPRRVLGSFPVVTHLAAVHVDPTSVLILFLATRVSVLDLSWREGVVRTAFLWWPNIHVVASVTGRPSPPDNRIAGSDHAITWSRRGRGKRRHVEGCHDPPPSSEHHGVRDGVKPVRMGASLSQPKGFGAGTPRGPTLPRNC